MLVSYPHGHLPLTYLCLSVAHAQPEPSCSAKEGTLSQRRPRQHPFAFALPRACARNRSRTRIYRLPHNHSTRKKQWRTLHGTSSDRDSPTEISHQDRDHWQNDSLYRLTGACLHVTCSAPPARGSGLFRLCPVLTLPHRPCSTRRIAATRPASIIKPEAHCRR